MELSLDDPHISLESDDVIYGKRNTYFKKRKKLKCSVTPNFDKNMLINEYCGRGNDRGSGEDEYNTQEQRTPTKRKRNIYFSNTINNNCNTNKSSYNNNDNDVGISHIHTSGSAIKNTDMVWKLYFHHANILFKMKHNVRKCQYFFNLILSYHIFIISHLYQCNTSCDKNLLFYDKFYDI